MRSVIRQSVLLPASAETLFEMYLDPEAHSAFSGSPVTIGREPGAAFRAFDGLLSGTICAVIPPRLIVQSWRSVSFYETDGDSTLVLCFSTEQNQGRIDLVHLDVPPQDFEGVANGWPKYYWDPWRAYLQRR